MTRVTPAADIGNHSMSLPIAITSRNIRWIVDAMVNSRTGRPNTPPAMQHALGAGREVAAHRVDARVQAADLLDEHAVVDAGDELGVRRVPGASDRGRVHPTPGVDLSPRTADAVDDTPMRRAV